MSDDESPTTGGQQPNAEYDSNNSIIEKVRTRVSSILPQTFSRWFSPNSGDSGSRNGSLRRRRVEMLGNVEDNTDDSDSADGDQDIAPPSKRIKHNIQEYTVADSYESRQQNVRRDFLSSTPSTIGRRRHMASLRSENESPYNFEKANTSTYLSSNLTEHQQSVEDNAAESEMIHFIHKNEDIDWENPRNISSRRSLNIPSTSSVTRRLPDLRRQSLKNVRAAAFNTQQTTAQSTITEELEDEEESELNEEDESVDNVRASKANSDRTVLTNGVRSSSSIVVQVDTTSESGDSQCSSFQRPKTSGLSNPSKSLRLSIGNGLNFYSHLEGKKSLFSHKNMPSILNNSTTSLTSLNRRQSFNSSLYGSTSALSDSRLLNTTSPFYKGRTTYGGASAYSKYSQQAQRTLRAPTLIRPTSNLSTLSLSSNSLAQTSDSSPAISNTAKRILELMNQFTSPLTDAKKMANNIKVPQLPAHRKRFGDAELNASRAIRMSTPKTPYSRPKVNEDKDVGPPIKELQVPSMSQLLQMKKLQNHTERVREIANSSKSILNQEQEYKLPTDMQNTDGSSKHVSKIKNKIISTRPNAKNALNERETLPPVNLPDIPLPLMKSVPKIDITISNASTSYSSTLVSNKSTKEISNSSTDTNSKTITTTPTPLFSSSIAPTCTTLSSLSNTRAQTGNVCITDSSIKLGINFKFSEPIRVSTPSKYGFESAISNFKFSDPVPVNNITQKTTGNFKYKPQEKPLPAEENEGSDNKLTSSIKTTLQLKTGSVLEALKNTSAIVSSKSSSAAGFGAEFKMPSDKWECSICLVRNNNDQTICVACQTPKQKTESSSVSKLPSSLNPPIKNTFGDAFKPKADTWECPSCMIRNEKELKQCKACTANQPGNNLVTTTTPVPKTTDEGFKNIVAQQSEKWECSVCMTRNDSNRSKCVCCEQAKPGTANVSSAPKFSFGASSSSKFTFGFATQKENEIKGIEENKTVTSSVLFEKDGETKPATGFIFGIVPASTSTSTNFVFKASESSTVKSKDVPDTPNEGIKLVAPVQSNKTEEDKSTKTGFTFGLIKSPAAIDNKKEDIPKESGGFKFGSPVATSTQSISQKEDKPSTSSGFKPVGDFTSGAPFTKSETATSKINLASKSTFNFAPPSQTGEVKPASAADKPSNTFGTVAAQKPDSTADVKKTFTFGSSEQQKTEEKKPTFGFPSEIQKPALPTFSVPSTTKNDSQNTDTASSKQTTASSKNTISTSTFVFGKPLGSVSATPLFGAVSSSTVASTSSAPVSSTPSFGSLASGAAATTTSIFGSPVNSSSTATSPLFGSVIQPKSSNFGSSFSASNNNTQQNNNQSSNLFAFSATKTEPNASVFGSVSSTTSKPFSFGTSNVSSNTTTPFLFGGSTQKPAESTSVFGAAGSTTGNATSGSMQPFGSFSSSATNSQPQNTSTFGQQPAGNATAPFGSNNPAPAFGSQPSSNSAFGSSSFGSSTFGAANNATFGTSPAPLAFGSSGFSSDGPAAKRPEPGFNFGPTTQNATGGFPFGVNNNNNNNNNNNKQPFSFSAPTQTKSFNFTGNQEAPNSSQPFQFGAAAATPAVFNFSGVETTPNAPFQFNAAAPAANNLFAPTPIPGTPTSAQTRRKIRQVARRTPR